MSCPDSPCLGRSFLLGDVWELLLSEHLNRQILLTSAPFLFDVFSTPGPSKLGNIGSTLKGRLRYLRGERQALLN